MNKTLRGIAPLARAGVSAMAVMAALNLAMPGDARAAGKARHSPQLEMAKPASAAPWVRYAGWSTSDWKSFNTLANMASPPYAHPPKLDGPIAGDPKKGEKLAYDRSRGGSCVACHVMGVTTPSLPGNAGPDLSTYATWGRDGQSIFNYVHDPRSVNPESVMPPWGAHGVFTLEETKDIVAFLKTLDKPATFKDALEDPNQRPVPKEDRDNLDPMVNSAMDTMEQGRKLFGKPGASGKSCASCHATPEKTFSRWAAGMPKYEPRMKKVLGVEEFVTRHARATTGDNHLMQSDENTALSIYLRYLANGQPIRVDTQSAGAKEANARGNALMQRKIGQLNFACTDCHEKIADRWIRGQWLTGQQGQTPHFPTWRTSRGEIWDIRKRFQWCNVAIRANELPPDAAEYGDIELALTAMSNGLKINVPGIRH